MKNFNGFQDSFGSFQRGIPNLMRGYALVQKEDKTPDEEIAANSFSRMCTYTFLVVLIGLAAMFVTMYVAAPRADGITRLGRRVGDKIVYAYQTMHEIDYDPQVYELADGENVILYLQNNGEIIRLGSVEEKDKFTNHQSIVLVGIMANFMIFLVGAIEVVRFKAGKEYNAWTKSNRMKNKNASTV